ncbi:MAG: DUF935 family protein [Candidatus Tectomicrobia bacterium]|nr:DUF935 family protein [Candidatus Tectomicrobia bacterium]
MPPEPTLQDHRGRPVRRRSLRRTSAAQSNAVAGARSEWYESLYQRVNPTTMAWILHESRYGFDLDRFLLLAEELEEVDTHYAGVLRARKRATTKLPLAVEPNGAAANVAAAADKLLQEPFVAKALFDILDALGKGFSCTEILWRCEPSGWTPRELKWRDPRHFRFDEYDRETILLRTGLAQAEPLPPFKFIYHQPVLKSGLPVRNGLARLCAWTWLYKHYTLRDWMAFLEIYGLPARVGKYGHSARDEDVAILKDEVAKLGSSAAAVIPDELSLEIVSASNAGGHGQVFEAAARYWDQALSKAIVGQTMTSESGSSLSQARVHMEVAHDVTESDARHLAMTLSEQLVMPYVQLNWGPQERYPLARFEIPQRPGENLEGEAAGDEAPPPARPA